ncbi:MAG TPA: chorismate synthase [Geobacteraceae bacterium]|nr:chorismate synthase [Geobacteraceae bacterium]
MLRYFTAGESHGPQLTAIIEGMPAGIAIKEDQINSDLARRQGGYGRGGRMLIEKDKVEILSGVRWGMTLGSPITLCIKNRDWPNWQDKMSPYEEKRDDSIRVTRPRPGHADLPGAIKYNHRDVRNLLERSSARETAIRVAVGSCAKSLLREFGINVFGFVTEIGGIQAIKANDIEIEELYKLTLESELFTFDEEAALRMKKKIDESKEAGDTLGGVIEVNVCGAPVGMGSHVQWDRKLDARLAMALMSIQAIKGVEVGIGFESARRPGSLVHDEIYFEKDKAGREKSGFYRKTNNAGGIEGGVSNGEPIIVRAAMKPIPTLYKPLKSVDIDSKEPFEATVERSDVCAVPAAAVVAEAVVAIEIANAFLEKFGGDSISEIKRNYQGYLDYLKEF